MLAWSPYTNALDTKKNKSKNAVHDTIFKTVAHRVTETGALWGRRIDDDDVRLSSPNVSLNTGV